jgi:HK97 family phage major capsid protein
MSTLLELQAQHDRAFAKADEIIATAERQRRAFTPHEQQTIDAALREASALKPQIEAAKAAPPIGTRNPGEARAFFDKQPRESRVAVGPSENYGKSRMLPERFSREYGEAFGSYLTGSGPLTASLEEGLATSGGYAVPIVVDQKVVPLAPQDSAVRQLATVIETERDITVAAITARATPALRTETSTFPVAQQTFGGFTLGAYSVGLQVPASIEFLSDVNWWKSIVLPDAVSGFLELEEGYYVNGTGSGQAQGLIGNVGAGVTCEPDTNGNLVSVDGIWQLVASLKDAYTKNASFLMTRATALGIRRAQVGSVFEPIFHRRNGQDECAGFPVAYSSQMPAAARGATPVLFGDFAKGYVVGDRGGSALLLKRVDQSTLMLSAGETILIFSRRSDGRVRVAEAIESLTISAS